MKQNFSGQRHRWRWVLPMVLVLVAAACGGGSSDTQSDDGDDSDDGQPAAASSSSSTPSSTTSTTTTTITTTTTTSTTTTAPPGPWDPHKDGENDCFKNSDYTAAPMCVPPDIDTVSITRASPLTIVTVFHAAVLGVDWQLTIGFDLDGDPTTGITDGIWSEYHGIGPDLEFDYFPDPGGGPFAQIHRIDPGPVFTMLEGGPPDQGPLAVWTWTDDQTLQVVISDTLVPDDISGFNVAGQTSTPDYSDAIPNEGPLSWP